MTTTGTFMSMHLFTGSVRAGSHPLRGWVVTMTFPDGQEIDAAWGASFSSIGSTVAAENTSWNGGLTPSSSTTLGFLGTLQNGNGVPTVTCSAV